MKEDNQVKKSLLEKGFNYNFFKAVNLLEQFSGGIEPGTGLSPSQDPVHFSVKPGFSFPASDIQGISANGHGTALKMTVNFMGLIGPKGVLPDWYNAYAENRRYKKDEAFIDFLDLFQHRAISLFYRAWKKYRLVENYRTDGTDAISNVLESLGGTGAHEKEANPEFFSHARQRLIFFCGLVSRTVPTVAAIETVASQAIGAPATVEQFVERSIPVHRQDRTRLGRRNSTLKSDALCGGKIRDASSFFRVHLGPLTWKQYLAFTPGSANVEMVRELIAYLAGIEYEFEIKLVIRGSEIPALRLGNKIQGPVLGRTATLRRPHRPFQKDIGVTAKYYGTMRKAA